MVMEQSVFVAAKPHGGLSPFGRDLIGEMNRLGIAVDLSHAAERGHRDAMSLASFGRLCPSSRLVDFVGLPASSRSSFAGLPVGYSSETVAGVRSLIRGLDGDMNHSGSRKRPVVRSAASPSIHPPGHYP